MADVIVLITFKGQASPPEQGFIVGNVPFFDLFQSKTLMKNAIGLIRIKILEKCGHDQFVLKVNLKEICSARS